MENLTFEQMEHTQGGMPCWAAKAALIAAGISFTFFTLGWGTFVVGLVGLGFAGYGNLESCYPELME
jgi:hypothetical protein